VDSRGLVVRVRLEHTSEPFYFGGMAWRKKPQFVIGLIPSCFYCDRDSCSLIDCRGCISWIVPDGKLVSLIC